MASFHLTVKVGKRGYGGRHADYIQRQGSYLNYRGGEDLVHVEAANIPKWAAHDPSEFFRQADLQERKNGSAYREFEVAIPKELSLEQRIDFIRDFVRLEIGEKHPIIWAIHNPSAAIAGGEQPHAHIMFSERTLDGTERDPEQFFKRFNAKAPETGGCQKSNALSGGLKSDERRSALVGLRARFANLQNEHLEKYGHDVRVSHLSLAAQGIERAPEKHMGPVASRDHGRIILLQEHRSATFLSEFYQQRAASIDTTGSLTAALLERQDNERKRAAILKLIGTNLTTADNHSRATKSDFSGNGRAGEVLANAAANYQHHRAVGEVTQAIVRQLGRACEEVARTTQHLTAIAKERDLASLYPGFEKNVAALPAQSAEDERKKLEVKYEARGVVRQFNHSRNAATIGLIVESTALHIVTNLGRDHYAIHDRAAFQLLDYDGAATGDDRLAQGNLARFSYNKNPALRRAMIEERRPERKSTHVLNNGIRR
ncbi:MAG: MobA/MobL family protein [Acidithiobacillus sp.]